MYCPKCGKSIVDESEFCRFCGTKVNQLGGGINSKTPPDTGDFITLNCPSCGGKLTFQPNTETLVCQFCDAEHLIRHSSNGFFLETYARCPTCRRNDKAVKVTVRFGDAPNPPYKTSLESNTSWGCLVFVYIWFAFLGVFAYWLDPQYVKYVVIGVFIMAVMNIWQIVKGRSRIKKYNSEIVEVNRQLEVSYQQSNKIWGNLYYCERDDTYFSIDDHHIWSKDEMKKLFPWWNEANDPYGY